MDNKKNIIFSGEIFIKSNDILDEEIDQELSDINGKINELDKELDRLVSHADKTDYLIAAASGILSAIIDSIFFGEIHFSKSNINISHKQINKFIESYADKHNLKGKHLNNTISNLENKYKVYQDNVWKGLDIGVSAKNHHLADIAHHPTPAGMIAAIIVQYFNTGIFVNKNGDWHLVHIKKSNNDIIFLLGAGVLTGIANWFINIAQYDIDDEELKIPKQIYSIAKILSLSPIIIEIMPCINNWFGHLVSDMGGSKNTAGKGMGIPGIFISLLYELASLPILKSTGLSKFIDNLYKKNKIDMRHELAIIENISRLSIPVIFNEIVTRSFYFFSRLISNISEIYKINELNWKTIIPFNNHTINRMLTVSSMTFNMLDITDAAVRGALECGCNPIIFCTKFASRFNYVGAGRAVFAVYKEFTYEIETIKKLCEKRELTKKQTALVIEKIEQYKDELQNLMCEYVLEDVTIFIEALDDIDRGIKNNDSNLVIKGNILIQNKFGVKEQFSNQKEFDDLMDSNDDFIL